MVAAALHLHLAILISQLAAVAVVIFVVALDPWRSVLVGLASAQAALQSPSLLGSLGHLLLLSSACSGCSLVHASEGGTALTWTRVERWRRLGARSRGG
jgi:hypothetical protein